MPKNQGEGRSAGRRRRFALATVSTVLLVALVFGCSALVGLDDPLGFNGPVQNPQIDSSSESSSGNPNKDGSIPTDDTGTGDGAPDGAIIDGAVDAFAPLCDGSVACNRVVFVTSQTYTGVLGGVAGADNKCQIHATGPTAHPRVKGRTFVAWISNTSNDAKNRHVAGTGQYILPSGAVIALNRVDLLDGTIMTPINETESGAALLAGSAWTSTTIAGDGMGGFCTLNWTNTTGSARVGDTTQVNGSWTNTGVTRPCTTPHHLYCIEL